MSKIKRLVAVVLAVLMIFGSVSVAASAWSASTNDGFDLNITTEIYRQNQAGEWIQTEKVKQGEEVKARISIGTEYYTNSGNLLFFYNNNFFEDSLGSSEKDVTVNSFYAELPYQITATAVGSGSTSSAAKDLVAAGVIDAAFAKANNFVSISYQLYHGSTNQMLDGSKWIFEIPLIVKADASGTGDFFALEESTRSTTFQAGKINVPKGPYNGDIDDVEGMHLWNANLTYTSTPVTIYDNFVTASFYVDSAEYYYAEGDEGDELTVADPSKTGYKFLGWKVKGTEDSTAAAVEKFASANTEYEAVWQSTVVTEGDLGFRTEIYREDGTDNWVLTEKVKPGETVKARLFVDTSYFTNAGNIILFYDNDFFEDDYALEASNILVTNPDTSSSAWLNGVTGTFNKLSASNNTLTSLVSNNYITQDFVDTHQAIAVAYEFNPTENKKISGEQWFVEFTLKVRETAEGWGDFFVTEDTVRTPGAGRKNYINIPLGLEGGSKDSTKSMHLWNANVTATSKPVTVNSTITLQANGGTFDAPETTAYVIDGVIGETVDYTTVPELTRTGYTFKGWVDASVENPTDADIVTLPTEMPYEEAEYKAYWINEVKITFHNTVSNTTVTKTVTAGAPFEAVPDPVEDGYEFLGWTDDETFIKISGLPAAYPLSDEDYYAVFESMLYTTKHYVLDTATSTFELVAEGETLFGEVIPRLPSNVYNVPEGHALSKGYTDVTFSAESELAADAKMPANDVNVYYYLTPLAYDAVFNANDGTYEAGWEDGSETKTVSTVYNEQIGAPEDPTRAGYKFVGWDPDVAEMDSLGKSFIATWEAIEYTVTYMANGEVHESFVVACGDDLDIASDPDVEGYEFLGWAETDGQTSADAAVVLPAKMPAGDTTYYAILDPIEYTITFSETGESTVPEIKQDFGTELPEVADPVKTGSTFIGWVDASVENPTEADVIELPETMPAKDMALKALWEEIIYTVTWDVDGELDVDEYNYGDTIVEPAAPTKPGYTFKEWTPAVKETMPAENLVYTATWDALKFDAIFNATDGSGTYEAGWDGEETKTVNTEFDKAIEVPADPEREGYIFAGWTPSTGMDIMDTVGGETYTATWEPAKDTKYTVKYYTMATDGTYGTPVVDVRTGTSDAPIDLTTVTTAPEGFYIDTETTLTPEVSVLTGSIGPDGETVLKVYYARNIYDITFDAVDGTIEGDATKAYYHGSDVIAPAVTDPDGYTFKGWNPDVSAVATKSETYVAEYTPIEYTITFDAQGGTPIDSVTADYKSPVAAPTAVTTKDGYTFKGWAETEGVTDETLAVTFPVEMPLNGDTYYAIWVATEYEIVFDTQGGTPAIDPVEAPYLTPVEAPTAVIEKAGYEFKGWAETEGVTDEALAVTFPVDMPLNGDTYYAIWSVKEYTITFDETGDTVINPITQDFGTEIEEIEDPVKEGHKFTGWVDENDEPTTVPTTMPADDVTIKATWERLQYTITFDTDGGNEIAPITNYFEEAVGTVANPEKQGYDFANWVDEDGNIAKVPSTIPSENITLKATWTPKTDTEYRVVVNYTDVTTGNAATYEPNFGDPYYGTTGNTVVIVEDYPDELADNTDYVLWSDLVVNNYKLDETAANEMTEVIAADGSTVLNLYYIPVKYTATFNATDGTYEAAFADNSTSKAVELDYYSLVKPNAPADPTREGYTFLGWANVDDATRLTGNRPFYAEWKANPYTLTWVIDETTSDVVDYVCDQNVDIINNPSKPGYEFKGWTWTYVDANGNTVITSQPSKMPAYDLTATANWEIQSYDVVWEIEGEETTETLEYGSTIVKPITDPVKEGYVFTGWEDENGNKFVDGTTVPVDGVKYIAKFEKGEYAVNYYVFEPANGSFVLVDTASAYYQDPVPATVPATYTAPEGYKLINVAYTDPSLAADKVLASTAVMPAADVNLYYTLEANTYSVVFDANSGTYADNTTSKTETIAYDAAIIAPAAPSKVGSTFLGWATEADATEAIADLGTLKTTDPVTYYAVWSVNKYDAVFKANGGAWTDATTGVSETTTVVATEYGAPISAPADPTRDGYEFVQWNPTVGTMDSVDGKTFTAEWKVKQYKVTFNTGEGGSTVAPITGNYGAKVTPPTEIPTKEGYTFVQWDSIPETIPAEDVTVNAIWKINTYKVVWNVDGVKTTDVYEYGETIVKPATTPTKEGYLFDKWTPDVEATMPANDLEYTATWTKQSYVATFDANGGVYTDGTSSMKKTFEYGATVTAPEIPTKQGYDHAGWTPALSTMPASNTTYEAVWTAKKDTPYIVEVYTMGLDGNYTTPETENKTAETGSTVKVTATVAEGFYVDPNEANHLEDVVAADGSTVLKVYYARESYTITFKPDNGEADTVEDYYYGTTVIAPIVEKTGYTFDGWDPGVAEKAVADATYTAKWDINEYTITFNETGDTVIAPITQDYATLVTVPENPTKEGYTFVDWTWTTKNDNGEDVEITEPATMPAYDVSAKANWTINQYTVTYYLDDTKTEPVVYSLKADYNQEYNVPTATKDGHTFLAWVNAETGEELGLEPGVVTHIGAKDVEYYATWDVNENSLIYMAQGGYFANPDDETDTSKTTQEYTVAYGTAKADMPAPEADPVRVGYEFTGWSALPETMPDNTVRITAGWQIQSYNADFYLEKDDETPYDTVPTPYDDYIMAPAKEDPTKEGHKFLGWSEDGVNVITDYGIMDTVDGKKFYAVWDVQSYYVTFVANDELFDGPNATVYGTAIKVPATEPTKKGHTFAGWLDADGNEIPATMPEAKNGLTFYAQWDKETYTVIWDVDGETTTSTVEYEGAINKPAETPTKEGFTFDKWVDAAGNEVPATMTEDLGDNGASVTYEAKWTKNKWTVTYNANGALYEGPTETLYGDDISVPAENPTKVGYNFDKWIETTDGKQPAEYDAMPDKSLVFEATWTPKTNVPYKLEIYKMDTEGNYPATATETVNFNDGVVGTDRTVEDYEVPAGFTLDLEDVETPEKSELTGKIPEEGTLVLKAYLIRNTYNFSTDIDGDVKVVDTYYYGEEIADVEEPTKTGYVFDKWVDSIPAVMPANDVTVKATWLADSFEATFDAVDGKFESTGETTTTVDVEYNTDIVAPTEVPVKEGWEFIGWTNDDGATVYKPGEVCGTMDENGAEFEAVWKKTDYTVTFYNYRAQNGVELPLEKYVYGSADYQLGDEIDFPADPSFQYQEFLGWSEVEGDDSNLISSDDVITMPAKVYALYAIYAPIPVKLIPKNDTCTTVIDRAGGDVDDYTASSEWYVYGLEEYLTTDILLDEYIDVQGDGRIELIYTDDNWGGKNIDPGTGTVINVYDRKGTADESDDVLVESFYIIIFGDLNGDAVIDSVDASYVYDEVAGITNWSIKGTAEYKKYRYRVKAGDVAQDKYIDTDDGANISDETIGLGKINQVTGIYTPNK